MQNVVKKIIKEATSLKNKYTKDIPVQLDYVCIFCQAQKELSDFTIEAEKFGVVVQDTPTGKIYVLNEKYPDQNGTRILKIRIPDKTRQERGDCDFKIDDYLKYKEHLLTLPIAKLITREDCEMIELWDKDFNVRVYFSNPPISEDLGV